MKAREDEVTLRERRIAVQEKLKEKNVPTELADFLIDLDENKTDEKLYHIKTNKDNDFA